MAVIEIKSEPSKRDLRMLAVALPAFFAVIAALAAWSPRALGGAAIFTGACWLIALALDRETPVRRKVWGLLFPVMLGGARAVEHFFGAGPAIVGASVLGVAGAAAALSGAGPAVYRAWMLAALPTGWVVSHVLLGLVYYGVITPIGLFLRLLGRDLLGLRMERGAASYWRERGPGEGAGRYFRQW